MSCSSSSIIHNSRKSKRTPVFLTKRATLYKKVLKTKFAQNDIMLGNDHLSYIVEPGWNPFQKLGIMITKPGKKKFWPQRALSAPVLQFRDHLISPSKIGFRSHIWGHPLGLLEVKNWSWSNFPIKSNLDFGNLESKPLFPSWILGGQVCSW